MYNTASLDDMTSRPEMVSGDITDQRRLCRLSDVDSSDKWAGGQIDRKPGRTTRVTVSQPYSATAHGVTGEGRDGSCLCPALQRLNRPIPPAPPAQMHKDHSAREANFDKQPVHA